MTPRQRAALGVDTRRTSPSFLAALYAFEATTREQLEELEFQAASRYQAALRRERTLSGWLNTQHAPQADAKTTDAA